MRVAAVGAHPDDLEILCGGTLAKYVELGHSVVMCHVSRGEKGGFHATAQEIARERDDEAQQSAQALGAKAVCLGFSDGEIYDDRTAREAIVDFFRLSRPDVIITNFPHDYMVDHNVVSKLVFDCSFLATVPLYKTSTPHHDRVTPIYYMDTLLGIGFQPVEYVDVTDAFDRKIEALKQHRSQLRWLREHDRIDLIDAVETVNRFRGYQAGVRYAEGFVPAQAWLRGGVTRVLP